MEIKKKRKKFFLIVIVLASLFYFLAMFHPVLRWADNCGIWVGFVPMSQFLIWVCSFSLAVLITLTYVVDTRVLIEKVDDSHETRETDVS